MLGFSKTKEVKVTSLEQYVREVSRIREEWLNDPTDELWFRGEDEKHSKTTLLAELYRSEKSLPEVLKKEHRLFDEFRRCGIQYSEFNRDDKWNWYLLMQHHGGPTRLLDWSDGSLMAAHFAIRSKTRDEDLKTGSVVYVLDPYWLTNYIDELRAVKKHWAAWKKLPENKTIPKDERGIEYDNTWLPGDEEDFGNDPLPSHLFLLDTDQITRRVAAQRSRLMVFGDDPAYLRKLAARKSSRIRKITIPGRCIPQMQVDIRDCGVTESVIYPDLDGIGREIKQLWQRFKAR